MVTNEKAKAKELYPFPVNNENGTMTVPNVGCLRDMLMEPQSYIHALGAVGFNLAIQAMDGESTPSSHDCDTLQCLYMALVELSDLQRECLEIKIKEVEEVYHV